MERICDKCLGPMDRNGTGMCFDCWRKERRMSKWQNV